MAAQSVKIELGEGKTITIESGKLAKQAAGSCVAQIGDTMVLSTVVSGGESAFDFFPLTVDYREKYYAAGKIPGGYIKREARPSDREILTSRIIDRPLRPMFPEGFSKEVQIAVNVLSADDTYDAESISVIASSVALGLSKIPFEEQVAAVKVVGHNGKFTVLPTFEEAETADIELIVAGSVGSVNMVEGSAWEVSEDTMVQAIMAGHDAIKKIIAAQNELIAKFDVVKDSFTPKSVNHELIKKIEAVILSKLRSSLREPKNKAAFYPAMSALKKEVIEALAPQTPEEEKEMAACFAILEEREMREMILTDKIRIDGRATDKVREIEISHGYLPRAHGSAIFQRGETQALVVCTLGTRSDEQRIDSLQGETFKNYMLHYNFPGFSVGEIQKRQGTGRREIGHGNLAERSLLPVLPTAETFPYTIRIVSDILESHGSSSMASVCGGTLCLMDAGVKIKAPVAGIAMGLISEKDRVEILSDINGTEDHLGDMDFKICGTAKGITAFQMDIKMRGITPEFMLRALKQASDGRLHILEKMKEALPESKELSVWAPAIIQKKIPADRIKEIIGPGGKVIRGIQENSGAELNIDDKGNLTISAPHRGNCLMALKMVNELFAEAEVGKVYKGKVKSITSFGAFVEILPGKEGLVHISELSLERVPTVESVVSLGDEIEVKCIGVDPQGKIKLSKKALLTHQMATN